MNLPVQWGMEWKNGEIDAMKDALKNHTLQEVKTRSQLHREFVAFDSKDVHTGILWRSSVGARIVLVPSKELSDMSVNAQSAMVDQSPSVGRNLRNARRN